MSYHLRIPWRKAELTQGAGVKQNEISYELGGHRLKCCQSTSAVSSISGHKPPCECSIHWNAAGHQEMSGNPHQRSAKRYLSPKVQPEWDQALAHLQSTTYKLQSL